MLPLAALALASPVTHAELQAEGPFWQVYAAVDQRPLETDEATAAAFAARLEGARALFAEGRSGLDAWLGHYRGGDHPWRALAHMVTEVRGRYVAKLTLWWGAPADPLLTRLEVRVAGSPAEGATEKLGADIAFAGWHRTATLGPEATPDRPTELAAAQLANYRIHGVLHSPWELPRLLSDVRPTELAAIAAAPEASATARVMAGALLAALTGADPAPTYALLGELPTTEQRSLAQFVAMTLRDRHKEAGRAALLALPGAREPDLGRWLRAF